MAHYEINVSLNGKHLFATAERSIQNMVDLADVLPQILKQFPESEGFEIKVTKYEITGQQLTEEMVQAYNIHKDREPISDERIIELRSKFMQEISRRLGNGVIHFWGTSWVIYYRKDPTFHPNPELTYNEADPVIAREYVELLNFFAPGINSDDPEALETMLDMIYHNMQGEIWSPHGEARDFIRGKGLKHTSMSVGDLMYNTDTGRTYEVMPSGFREINI